MRILQIWNPVSGRGNAAGLVTSLAYCLERAGHKVWTRQTRCLGDARKFAAEASEDLDVIVVAGGDGTLNEVLNGLDSPLDTPIAILPAGGANVLARDLSIPHDVNDIAKIIDRHVVKRIDLGLIGTSRRFCAMASVGFDATVVKRVGLTRRCRLGKRGYVVPVLATALSHVGPRLRICVDDSAEVSAAAVLIMNTRSYAGILTASSTARCDSGLFHILALPGNSIFALVRYGVAGLWKEIGKCSDVTSLTGTKVSIRSDALADVQIDGEYFGTTPVDIEIMPRSAVFLVP